MKTNIIAATVVLLIVVGLVVFFLYSDNSVSNDTSGKNIVQNGDVNWRFNSGKWLGVNAPTCPKPLVLDSPVNVNLASGVLYPGQLRGGDYKPHGGFRFDNRETNTIEVRAIMDGYILRAARYEDGGEMQYFMFYVHDCGIMIMHDHLLTPSPKLKEIFDALPIGYNGDTRTTEIVPKVYIKKGELLATEIGYKKNKNIFLDFGLYDLRATNGVTYSSEFRRKNPNINEHGAYAVCFLNYLNEQDSTILRNLPAGIEGKVSDYCN